MLTVFIVACSSDDSDNGGSEQVTCPIYLASNGLTIKACDEAEVYSTGTINGITYTVVNEIVLRDMIENGDDVSKVVTTKVTDMNGMFSSDETFNQDISSWDVSNVIDMASMFANANSFNQDISSWDVSSVTNMSNMFNRADIFSQDIANWDVSDVNYCNGFSWNSSLTEAKSPNFMNCIEGICLCYKLTFEDLDGDGCYDPIVDTIITDYEIKPCNESDWEESACGNFYIGNNCCNIVTQVTCD